jgi:hypothetical protein
MNYANEFQTVEFSYSRGKLREMQEKDMADVVFGQQNH